MEKISQINERLLKMFDDASELESAVLDAEELHEEITDKIARTRQYIELNNMEQPGRVLPVCQPSVELQLQAIVTLPVDQSLVTAQGVNFESGLKSVNTTTTQNILPIVTFTTAEHHNTLTLLSHTMYVSLLQ